MLTRARASVTRTVIKLMVAEGHKVRGTVRNEAESGEFVKALGAEVCEVKELGDKEALQKAFAGVDGIFHLAAVHPEYGFAETPEGETRRRHTGSRPDTSRPDTS